MSLPHLNLENRVSNIFQVAAEDPHLRQEKVVQPKEDQPSQNTNTGGKGGKTSAGIGSVENLKIGNMSVALGVTAVIVTQF